MRADYYYQAGDTTWKVTVEQQADHIVVTIGDRVYQVRLASAEAGRLAFELEGRRWQVDVAHAGLRRYVAIAGESWRLERATGRPQGRGHSAGGASGELAAEMPGQVLEVLVMPGEKVSAGQALVLLEAMKMELRVTAPAAGRINQVHCTPGQVVERGQALVEFEAEL
jgi:acetyl/propionyl-CoA carboxylase alpha subunit